MGKRTGYIADSNGKYFICQLDKGVLYGPCVFCGEHREAGNEDFCKPIQYWDNHYDTYVLCEGQ